MSDRSNSLCPRGVTRRDFLKLAAAAGLLAGCNPNPTASHAPTPLPPVTLRRPEVIKTYPDVPSKVVRTHHAGVWDNKTLVPGAIRQMLDASITELTGLNDAGEAWAALFAPDERVAIKVNPIDRSSGSTHIPLVMAAAECLQEVGIPAEQIVIFDRRTDELKKAGYSINVDGSGVRCYGTDGNYTGGWKITDVDVGLSNVLLSCDALINMPILKSHSIAGITFAMKNHYGTFDKPQDFHGGRMGRGMAELNNLPPIKDRTRLIIGDALKIIMRGLILSIEMDDSIFMSFDPVAHDAVGLPPCCKVMAAQGRNSEAAIHQAKGWLEGGTEVGLGAHNLDDIELVELVLA
jgi:hypothetical protein